MRKQTKTKRRFYWALLVPLIGCLIVVARCKDELLCSQENAAADKISVQSTDSIFDRILTSKKRCLPRKVVLRVPDNFQPRNTGGKSDNSSLTITTLVTTSNESRKFHIIRIDSTKGEWKYTKKDSCLSWKWQVEDGKQVLTLSLERNLQIHSGNLVLIIVLPFELLERSPEIYVEKYTLDRAGRYQSLEWRNYPALREVIRLVETEDVEAGKALLPEEKVSPEVASELMKIHETGGTYLDKDLDYLLKSKDLKKYEPMAESPSCEIPKDLNPPGINTNN